MRVRVNADGGIQSPGSNCDPHYGELVFTNWDSAAGPISDEVMDGTGCAVGLAYGLTLDAAAGTITCPAGSGRPGVYQLDLIGSSQGSDAADDPTYSIQKNSVTLRSAHITNAATVALTSVVISILVALSPGDVIRAIVTDGAGADGVEDFNGVLRVMQVSDLELSV